MKTRVLRLAIAGLVAVSVSATIIAAEKPPAEANPAVSAKARPKSPPKDGRKPRAESPEEAKKRAEALHAIMARLGVGQGATVADVGAGKGRDSWVFAEVVGHDGAVYSEEITEENVNSLKKEAERRELPQIHPVLGRDDDPRLPEASVDLEYMHYVYHHFSKPRDMLGGLWHALKPGGYLVVVDRHRGTLQDWVPRDQRAKKHYWLAETTVVREAREGGFAFVECAEDCWPADDQFVLVFQRPKGSSRPSGDPDPFLPLPLEKTRRLLVPSGHRYRRPVFIALGEARKLIGPILESSSGPGLDVVLEEWATQKDERPPLSGGVSLPAVLTENGDPHLGDEPVDVVFFLDSYDLLFHHETLLAKLCEKLTPTGRVWVLDRKAAEPLCRREASHRRKIAPETVKQEMAEAGFHLLSVEPPPGTDRRLVADRFLLVFGKTPTDPAATK